MCGRIIINVTNDELKDYLYRFFSIEDYLLDFYLPRYNLAPSQMLISVVNDGFENQVSLMKWGFIPYFVRDESKAFKMINARAETIAEKPAFKYAFQNQRCLILANGYYEWQKNGDEKIPMLISKKDQSLFAFAGLWSEYRNQDGTKINTCTIITTNAARNIANIHERMPVILNPDAHKYWLDPKIQDPKLLSRILLPYPNLTYYQVSK